MEKKYSEKALLSADLSGKFLLESVSRDMKAIGLFYAPAEGSVEKVAKLIKSKIKKHPVEMFYIIDVKPSKLLDYQNIILVSSTVGLEAWNNEERDRWGEYLPELRKLRLNGRKVALVGLGNQILYPRNFVDGLKRMADFTKELGGEIVGKTVKDGYTFEESLAIEDNLFLGLPIDEDTEPEKTETRVEKWLSMLLGE